MPNRRNRRPEPRTWVDRILESLIAFDKVLLRIALAMVSLIMKTAVVLMVWQIEFGAKDLLAEDTVLANSVRTDGPTPIVVDFNQDGAAVAIYLHSGQPARVRIPPLGFTVTLQVIPDLPGSGHPQTTVPEAVRTGLNIP